MVLCRPEPVCDVGPLGEPTSHFTSPQAEFRISDGSSHARTFPKETVCCFATASLQAPFERNQNGGTGVRLPCICSPWPECVSCKLEYREQRSKHTRALSDQIPQGSVPSQAQSTCLCWDAWDAGARCGRVKVVLRMLRLLFLF